MSSDLAHAPVATTARAAATGPEWYRIWYLVPGNTYDDTRPEMNFRDGFLPKSALRGHTQPKNSGLEISREDLSNARIARRLRSLSPCS